MTSAYDSDLMARAYAFDRPSVHGHLLRSARLTREAEWALDVGCGAGVSTAVLAPLARRVVGVEPVSGMLAHRRAVAPQAIFIVGRAESLPFAARSFDLVTAAGSMNYTDLPSALAEIARVLTDDGVFLLYDFSTGRRSTSGDELSKWYDAYEQRFPASPGWRPLDPRTLPLAAHGLSLLDYAEVETPLPMNLDAYLRYVLSESGVYDAVARGVCSDDAARDWCGETLTPLFSDGELTVIFPGYIATIALSGPE